MILASISRFRPIMLTAVSTMLGLITIAATFFWGPMAFAPRRAVVTRAAARPI